MLRLEDFRNLAADQAIAQIYSPAGKTVGEKFLITRLLTDYPDLLNPVIDP